MLRNSEWASRRGPRSRTDRPGCRSGLRLWPGNKRQGGLRLPLLLAPPLQPRNPLAVRHRLTRLRDPIRVGERRNVAVVALRFCFVFAHG